MFLAYFLFFLLESLTMWLEKEQINYVLNHYEWISLADNAFVFRIWFFSNDTKINEKIINFANFKGNVAKLWEFFIVVSKFSQQVKEKLWKYGIVGGSVWGAPDAKEILKN